MANEKTQKAGRLEADSANCDMEVGVWGLLHAKKANFRALTACSLPKSKPRSRTWKYTARINAQISAHVVGCPIALQQEALLPKGHERGTRGAADTPVQAEKPRVFSICFHTSKACHKILFGHDLICKP
jgi:hypothetical protein